MSKARDLADSAQEINILDGKSFLDEDNLASDSATGIASQQSIKAYVDGITTTNITSTGALNSGSITSGFGNIDNGSSTITTTGAITGGSFVIGSADINENDLESIDGITAGTVSASKAVVVNTNKDITGFRNLTATGTITGSLSGTLSGSLSSTTTATTQAESDDSTKIATTAYVVDKITTLIGGAPSTLNDLNELAAAINDDANYNSTLTTALATKLPLAGGTMTGDVLYNDNVKAKFGDGSDLQIYHTATGNHSIIAESGAGNLILAADNLEINNAANNANKITATTGGAVTLYHNNAAKLATTSTGIQVTGNITNASGDLTLDVAGNIILDADGGIVRFYDSPYAEYGRILKNGNNLQLQSQVNDGDIVFKGIDNNSTITALTLDMSEGGRAYFTNGFKLGDTQKAFFGDSNDLEIYHNSTNNHSYISEVGSGSLILSTNGSTVSINTDGSENMAVFRKDGSVDLFHNNSKKFETTSSGVNVTGNVTVTGTLDGRDLAADGVRLDTMATNANNYSHPTGNGNNHIPSGGSTDQILKYASAGTAQWADASGGSRVLLNRSVMNTTSTFNFTAMNNSLYDSYYVEFEGLQPSNGGASQLRVYLSDDNLSTELGDVQSYGFKSTGSATPSGFGIYGYMLITSSVGDPGYYGPCIAGHFRIMNVNNTNSSYVLTGQSYNMNNSNQHVNTQFGAMNAAFVQTNLPQVNSFRMKFHSGTMVRGIIKVYGVLNS